MGPISSAILMDRSTTATTSDRRLRVLFVTENDPLYVIRFFEVFFAEYPREEFDLCGITVDEAFHEPIWRTARRMLGFYGPIDFVRLGSRFALTRLSRHDIEKLARKSGIEVIATRSVNAPEYIRRVKEIAPDVIVSVAAPEIFRREILSAANRCCVNIHSGRLPRYRGMMPNFWQLLHGERAATVTVHLMAEKLDAGDVLATQEVPLRKADSLDRVIVETKRQGARLMIDVLRRIASDEIEPQPLDMTEAGYFSFPKPADVRLFRKRGHRML